MSKLVRCTLGDIGKVKMCKRVLKNQTSESGDIPFYKISTFGGEPSTFISRELFDTYKKEYSYPKKGDVLLSAAGTLGKKIVFNGEKAYFQDSNIVWLENDESKVLNKYLYYFYDVIKWKKTSGSTIDRLYNENILGAEIYYPDMATQKQIVNTLSLLDSKIENNNKIISTLESLAKTIYDYWFLQFEFPNEDGKPYKSSGGKMVWNDELKREIPEGWKVKSYSKLGKLLMGQSPKSDSYNNEGIGYPLINGAAELREDSVAISKYTSNPTRVSQIGDLLFCIRATIGNLQFGQAEYCLGRGVASYRPNSKKHIEYLYFVTNDILAVYNKILTGSIIVGISKDDLLQQPILTTNESIINAFSETVHPMFETIANLKKENQELASLRDFLLPMLMNGQVTFKEDE